MEHIRSVFYKNNKIKMKQQKINLTVPTSWNAITLEKYLTLKKDMDNYMDNEEALTACLLNHLCGLDLKYIKQIDADTIQKIKTDLFHFMNQKDFDLINIIEIDGIKYGFEPNLSKMSYGAYLDITSFQDITINEDWNKIMSILYRPVIKYKKRSGFYSIEEYDSDKIKPEIFNKISMDIHFGALFFFIDLSKDCSSSILKYLITKTQKSLTKKKFRMGKNGKDIQQSLSSLTEIYNKLTK